MLDFVHYISRTFAHHVTSEPSGGCRPLLRVGSHGRFPVTLLPSAVIKDPAIAEIVRRERQKNRVTDAVRYKSWLLWMNWRALHRN